MKKTFGFNEQLKVGDVGETHLKERYEFLAPVKSDKFEIDFTLKNGKTVELKTDSYPMDKTDNFFMETISNTNNGKLGGVFRAKQDKIDLFVYYFLANRTFFWFKVDELYDRVEKLILSNNYKTKSIWNKGWTTEGYALPRSEFSDIITLEDKW